jgi:uncharacterized protein YxjI
MSEAIEGPPKLTEILPQSNSEHTPQPTQKAAEHLTPHVDTSPAVRSELQQLAKKGPEKAAASPLHPAFMLKEYIIDKNWARLFGSGLSVTNSDGEKVMQADEKPFRMKDEYTLYDGKEKKEPFLSIKEKGRIDEMSTFDIFDPKSSQLVGSVKRHMMRSNIQTTWSILSGEGKVIGTLKEKSIKKALLARALGPWVARNYTVATSDDKEAATIVESRNPFSWKMKMKVSDEPTPIDKRLLVAAGILLANVDGRGGKTKAK